MQDNHRRVLVWYRKEGAATGLSHLELSSAMEEAFTRSGLPVRRSGGAVPKVKMSFPTALPQGMESLAEVVMVAVEHGPTLRPGGRRPERNGERAADGRSPIDRSGQTDAHELECSAERCVTSYPGRDARHQHAVPRPGGGRAERTRGDGEQCVGADSHRTAGSVASRS